MRLYNGIGATRVASDTFDPAAPATRVARVTFSRASSSSADKLARHGAASASARCPSADEALIAVSVASYRRRTERFALLRLLLSAKGQVDVCECLPTVHPRRNASASK